MLPDTRPADILRTAQARALKLFTPQVDAIRRGLECVVPAALLLFPSADDLEEMVCGRTRVDVDLLQRMTTYNHCSKHDQHVKYVCGRCRCC